MSLQRYLREAERGYLPACELLAAIGMQHLAQQVHSERDSDDAHANEWPPADHHAAKLELLKPAKKAVIGDGVTWGERRISWPDRVPGLVTWTGQQTLASGIRALQGGLRDAAGDGRVNSGADIFEVQAPMTGGLGVDPTTTLDAADVGFSTTAQKMPVMRRVGIELLAVLGLETVPLVSFGWRECGFIFRGRMWTFSVEPRAGGYYYRWGNVQLAPAAPNDYLLVPPSLRGALEA